MGEAQGMTLEELFSAGISIRRLTWRACWRRLFLFFENRHRGGSNGERGDDSEGGIVIRLSIDGNSPGHSVRRNTCEQV